MLVVSSSRGQLVELRPFGWSSYILQATPQSLVSEHCFSQPILFSDRLVHKVCYKWSAKLQVCMRTCGISYRVNVAFLAGSRTRLIWVWSFVDFLRPLSVLLLLGIGLLVLHSLINVSKRVQSLRWSQHRYCHEKAALRRPKTPSSNRPQFVTASLQQIRRSAIFSINRPFKKLGNVEFCVVYCAAIFGSGPSA